MARRLLSIFVLLLLTLVFHLTLPVDGTLLALASSTRAGASTDNVQPSTAVAGQRIAAGTTPVGLTDLAWEHILTQIEQDGVDAAAPTASQAPLQATVLLGNEVAKLTANDAQAGDHFGFVVAVDGDTVLVGADEEAGGPGDALPRAGAAYIFVRNHGGTDAWGQVAKLTADDAQANDSFGVAVALDGDTALVGSRQIQEASEPDDPQPEPGAAYIFERNQGGTEAWGQIARLSTPDAPAGAYFGLAVALDGDTALIGAFQADGGVGNQVPLAGAAYIFSRNQGGMNAWGQVATLTAADAQEFDYFGYSVALDGDTALVGAISEAGGDGEPMSLAGAAYIFTRHHGGTDAWGQVTKLSAADAQELAHFGYAVAVDGDTALVSALYEAGGEGDAVLDAGAAYVFGRHQGGTDAWGQVTKLSAADATSGAGFGIDVALDGDTALVGANYANGTPGSRIGAAYVFRRHHGGTDSWGQVDKLTASDAQPNDGFGIGVGLDGDTALVGAIFEAGGAGDPLPEAGAAYIYQLTPPVSGKGKVTIVLDAQPNSAQDFRFTGDLGYFRLDNVIPSDEDGYSQSKTFEIEAGVYTVREQVPGNWLLANISCNPAAASSVDLDQTQVTITLVGDGDVTCTFTNQRRGHVRVVNYVVNYKDSNGDARQNWGERPLNQWGIRLYEANGARVVSGNDLTNQQGKEGYPGLRPGNYTVCEELQEGWFNTQPGLIDAIYQQPCYVLTLGPGQIAQVDFGNMDRPVVSAAQLEGSGGVVTFDAPDVEADDENYEVVDRDEAWINASEESGLYLPQIGTAE